MTTMHFRAWNARTPGQPLRPGFSATVGRGLRRLTRRYTPPAWQQEPVNVESAAQLFHRDVYGTTFALLQERNHSLAQDTVDRGFPDLALAPVRRVHCQRS